MTNVWLAIVFSLGEAAAHSGLGTGCCWSCDSSTIPPSGAGGCRCLLAQWTRVASIAPASATGPTPLPRTRVRNQWSTGREWTRPMASFSPRQRPVDTSRSGAATRPSRHVPQLRAAGSRLRKSARFSGRSQGPRRTGRGINHD
jgi:hypothetical protein